MKSCKNCGLLLKKQDKFCSKCGHKIESTKTTYKDDNNTTKEIKWKPYSHNFEKDTNSCIDIFIEEQKRKKLSKNVFLILFVIVLMFSIVNSLTDGAILEKIASHSDEMDELIDEPMDESTNESEDYNSNYEEQKESTSYSGSSSVSYSDKAKIGDYIKQVRSVIRHLNELKSAWNKIEPYLESGSTAPEKLDYNFIHCLEKLQEELDEYSTLSVDVENIDDSKIQELISDINSDLIEITTNFKNANDGFKELNINKVSSEFDEAYRVASSMSITADKLSSYVTYKH